MKQKNKKVDLLEIYQVHLLGNLVAGKKVIKAGEGATVTS